MISFRKKISGLMLAVFCLLPAIATSETLNFASPVGPRATINQQVFEPWIEKIVEDSDGALRIRAFYASPLGNYRNMYDRVNDGVVHMAFTTIAPIGGKFLRSDVASLPFEVENSLEGSVALWNLYENGVITDEFEDIKLLAVFMFPNSALHMGEREVRTLEDFRGIKIRTAGKLQSDTLSLLGGSPVTTAIGDTYPGLERGVFDGAIMPWTGIAPFRLDEVTSYHMNAPLGSSVAMVFMNKRTYEKLSPAAKRAIDQNSGLPLSIWASTHNDEDAARIEARVRQQENQIVRDIDPEEAARWRETIQPVIDRWIVKTPNGADVLAAFRKEIALIRASQDEVTTE